MSTSFKNILSYIPSQVLPKKASVGVEYFIEGSRTKIIYTHLEQKKGLIENGSTLVLNCMEELAGKFEKRTPVNLCINGKGIMHRKVNGPVENDKNGLEQALPNASPEDFYIQFTEGYNRNTFISVARRSQVDHILEAFANSGYRVVSCSLGPFVIGNLISLMDLNTSVYENLSLGSFDLGIISGKVDDYKTSDSSLEGTRYKVGNEWIKGEHLLSFSSAMLQYTGFSIPHNIESVQESKEEFRQENIFRLTVTFFLVFLLALMGTNGILFNHYSSKNTAMASELDKHKSIIQYMDTLQKSIAEKRAFLENTGLLESSKVSYYADQLTLDLPQDIRLQKMDINPAVKKMEESTELLLFSTKVITISGLCKKSNELNEWIKLVKRKKWVLGVTLIHYNQDKANEAGIFTIDISIA
jgi:Tfp pilus assembly protein PilN